MKTLRLGLSGAKGRMGKTLCEIISVDSRFEITSRYDTQNPLDSWNPSNIDIVIDFSLPESFVCILDWCRKNKKPLVSGTTGLKSKEKSLLQESASVIPILWAPNMSLGVACLNEWLKNIPKEIQKWSFQIEETHHKQKKDQPSGTALFLNQTLKNQGIQPQEILSKRQEDVFGIHQMTLSNNDEIITLKHQALNRKIFAQGALFASTWLMNQASGLYELKNCLEI